MSSRVLELEVNYQAVTVKLKELQDQLDAQALQNRFSQAFHWPLHSSIVVLLGIQAKVWQVMQ